MSSPFYAKGSAGAPVDLVTQVDRTMEFWVQGHSIGTVDLPPYNPIIYHGTDGTVARIEGIGGTVIWIGSVEPINALEQDEWHDISGDSAAITTVTLANMYEDAPTTQQLIATGTTPIVWSHGTLPANLTLSESGELAGRPAIGSSGAGYSFTATATNGFGSDTKTYAGTFGAPVAPTITTTIIDTLGVGSVFSQQLVSTGSGTPTWAHTSGTLPAGLTLSSGGLLSGTPTTATSYTFGVTAANGAGSGTHSYTVTVAAATPVNITTTTLPNIPVGSPYTQVLSATGSLPITWRASSSIAGYPTGTGVGTGYPPGMRVTAAGAWEGTPTVAGTYTFDICANNVVGTLDTQSITMSVQSLTVDYRGKATYGQGAPPYTISGPSTAVVGDFIVAWIAYNASGTPSLTATYGGNAMTIKGHSASISSVFGMACAVYGPIPSGLGGTQSIVVTSSANAVRVHPIAYSNVGTAGALQSTSGSSGTLTQSCTSGIGNRVAQAFMHYPGTNTGNVSAYNKSERDNVSGNISIWVINTIAGDADGASSVSFSATAANAGGYVGLAVNLVS